MKTMTCGQLGGPCDRAFQGENADEIIAQQDRHLKEAVKAGDATHVQADDDMRGRWKRPKKSLDWYVGVKREFAALPQD